MADKTITSREGQIDYLSTKYGLNRDQAERVIVGLDLPDFDSANSLTGDQQENETRKKIDEFAASNNGDPVAMAAAAIPDQQTQAGKDAAGQVLADTTKAVAGAKNPQDAQTAYAAGSAKLAQLAGAGTTQPKQVFDLLGRPLTPQETAHAIQIYNQTHPQDQLGASDSTGFFDRVQFAPDALDAVAQSVEGVDVGMVHFNTYNPTTKRMEAVPIARDQVGKADSLFPNLTGKMGSIVGSSQRTGGEVPWQLLASATHLMQAGKVSTGGAPPLKGAPPSLGLGSKQVGVAHAEAVNTAMQAGRAATQDGLATVLRSNLRKFGDPALALIALKNPSLAQTIYDQGGSTANQAQEAAQILADANFDDQSMAALGYQVNKNKMAAILGQGGGSTTTVSLPDPEGLKSGAISLYRAWFAREPTGDELAHFVGAINSRVVQDTKKQANPFKSGDVLPQDNQTTTTATDPQAQLEASLRQTPEYSQLFGNKPIGETETDYANQFRSVGKQLLGETGIVDPDALRVGMQTGSPQDTLRYLSGKGSSLENSPFQQRITQALNAIAQVT